MQIDGNIAAQMEKVFQPPAIVRKVEEADPSSSYFAFMLPVWADEVEADVRTRMDRARKTLTKILATSWLENPKNIDFTVDWMENFVADIAARLEKLLGKLERQFARALKSHPGLAKLKPYHDRIIAAGRRENEEKLDMQMSFRALRAERSEDSRGGPTFDNAEDLDAYLKRELA